MGTGCKAPSGPRVILVTFDFTDVWVADFPEARMYASPSRQMSLSATSPPDHHALHMPCYPLAAGAIMQLSWV